MPNKDITSSSVAHRVWTLGRSRTARRRTGAIGMRLASVDREVQGKSVDVVTDP